MLGTISVELWNYCIKIIHERVKVCRNSLFFHGNSFAESSKTFEDMLLFL